MKRLNIHEVELEFDPEDPEGYKAGGSRLGPQLGAARLGATVYEIPPGQSLCPYHYETEEEWLLVLSGELTVRHVEGEDVFKAGDITAFPVGPSGAHKTTNKGSESVRLLMFSNVDPTGWVVYPDSEKFQMWSPSERVRRRIGPEVEYYDGEV
jgi:uncharacterized cupin superfamily protein